MLGVYKFHKSDIEWLQIEVDKSQLNESEINFRWFAGMEEIEIQNVSVKCCYHRGPPADIMYIDKSQAENGILITITIHSQNPIRSHGVIILLYINPLCKPLIFLIPIGGFG